MDYGPQPAGQYCYCFRPNNPIDCLFPSCGARADTTAFKYAIVPKLDWAQVYAKMDRK
jgi:hypothetical protein